MKPSPKKDFDFRMFMVLKLLFKTIYYGEMSIPAIEREKDVFDYKIGEVERYGPRTENNISDKNKVLTNAQNLYDGREMIINTFKNELFPLYSGNYYEEFKEESSESEGEDEKAEHKTLDIDTSEQITMLYKFHGPDLIDKYFNKKSLIEIINTLKDYRKDPKTHQKYINLMTILFIGLNKLRKDMENMPEDEVKKQKTGLFKRFS